MLDGKRVYQTWHDSNVYQLLKGYGAKVSYDPYDDFDLAVFTGGSDICSYLYGEEPHPRTSANYDRDLRELKALREIPFGTPVIGICRGAQLLNVHAGGSMFQHVDGHMGVPHDAVDMRTGQAFRINSIHHQMMIPASHATILMKAGVSTEKHKGRQVLTITEAGRKNLPDPEVLFIPQHNYLCYQGHPEYAHEGDGTRRSFEMYVKEFIVPLLS